MNESELAPYKCFHPLEPICDQTESSYSCLGTSIFSTMTLSFVIKKDKYK